MTQVNLLPAEVKQRQRTRRATGLIVAGGAAVIGLLMLLFVLQSGKLNQANEELSAQQSANTALQSEIAGLQKYRTLKEQVVAKEAIVAEAMSGTIRWSGVLRDVSIVIPEDMWLTGMSGALTVPTASAPTGAAVAGSGASTDIAGNIQFQGSSFDQPTIAQWLKRLDKVEGWDNPWLASSQKDAGGVPVYTFSGTVDLTTAATIQNVGSPQ